MMPGQVLGRAPRAVGTAYIDKSGRVRKAPRPVAGFDLTFSAPKSVSVGWAMAEPGTQAVIYRAHLRAVEFVIGYAERAVFASRSGHAGVVQEDVRGWSRLGLIIGTRGRGTRNCTRTWW